MKDYPTSEDPILKALDNLPQALKPPFISTEGLAKSEIAGGSSKPKLKTKVKYSCPECLTNAWDDRLISEPVECKSGRLSKEGAA